MNDRSDEITESIKRLEEDEAGSRPYRARRLQLLLSEYGPEGIRVFYGGHVSAMAFEEARQAYLHGLFLACTIMCQVCLEHMLASLFRMTGRNDLERASFETLLLKARANRILSEEEFSLFDRLRMIRNPYVHPRGPTVPSSITRRAMMTDTPVEDLVADDAEFAIVALLRLCRRPPFALSEEASR